jgi:DNA-binding CsgD family transcriptional regulator
VVTTQQTRLSPRERQVLTLAAEDCGYKEIARRLGIRVDTVKGYVETAKRRLGVSTLSRAVVVAIRDGMIEAR